jgi:hypothetical protein
MGPGEEASGIGQQFVPESEDWAEERLMRLGNEYLLRYFYLAAGPDDLPLRTRWVALYHPPPLPTCYPLLVEHAVRRLPAPLVVPLAALLSITGLVVAPKLLCPADNHPQSPSMT